MTNEVIQNPELEHHWEVWTEECVRLLKQVDAAARAALGDDDVRDVQAVDDDGA
jgi:predicted Zn-dependent protease